MTAYPKFFEFDFATLTLSPPVVENNKTRIKITNREGKVPHFNLVAFTNRPLNCKWALDAPSADGDPDRRTQPVSLGDGDLLHAVRKFDNFVLDYAVQHSEQLFGKKLNRDQVEQRYEKMEKINERFPGSYIKLKVKVGDSKVPTKLQRGADKPWATEEEGMIDHSVLEEAPCRVSPVISLPMLWIIGKGTSARFGAQVQAESMFVWPGQKRNVSALHSDFAPPEDEPEAKKQDVLGLASSAEPEAKAEEGGGDVIKVPLGGKKK